MNVVAVALGQGRRDGCKVLEERQHLVVGSIIGDEEAQVGIVQDSGNSDQACPSTRDNGNVLPRILARLVLAVLMVVQIGHGFPQRFDTSSRAILPSCHRDIDRLGTVEAPFDVVVDFWSPLTKIGPLVGTIREAMLICTLGAPHHAGGGTGRIKAGMRSVTFVGIAKLLVDLGATFTASRRQ